MPVVPLPSHRVQLFDELGSLALRVSTFIGQGLDAGSHALVVAKAPRLQAITEALVARGHDVEGLRLKGEFVPIEASAALTLFMRHGTPNSELFAMHIGSRVATMARQSPGLFHVYGDMVDVLADDRELRAAAELEHLWNELAKTVPFALLCGYSSLNFTDSRTRLALETICAAHSAISATAGDMLSEFVLRDLVLDDSRSPSSGLEPGEIQSQP